MGVDLILKQIIKGALPLSASRTALNKPLLWRIIEWRANVRCGKFHSHSITSSLKNQRQKNDTGTDLFPIDPAAARVTSNFNQIRQKQRQCWTLRRGLTSGDDADVSVVHAKCFHPFSSRMSQEGLEGVGQEAAAAGVCSSDEGKKKWPWVRTKGVSTGSWSFFHIKRIRNIFSRYLPE